MDKGNTKSIDYLCMKCRHEWVLEYQKQAIPPVQVACPKCKRLANHRRPYSFFEDERNKK